jgi:hypothetical protein
VASEVVQCKGTKARLQPLLDSCVAIIDERILLDSAHRRLWSKNTVAKVAKTSGGTGDSTLLRACGRTLADTVAQGPKRSASLLSPSPPFCHGFEQKPKPFLESSVNRVAIRSVQHGYLLSPSQGGGGP